MGNWWIITSRFLRNNAMGKQLLSFLKRYHLYVLAFALLLVFSIHSFESIGQDIGRHLKVGEIIWQTKSVPKTNLFSFTEPDFYFVNHHWLSEVIFFKIFNFTGFTGLILVKVFLILASFLLLFFTVKNYAKLWSLVISFLFSIFVFIQRTEVRPEIFSFAIVAFFLFVLFKAKYQKNYLYLWFLPFLELFWVNLHIYFFIGPFLIFAFLVDRLISKDYAHIKTIIAVLLLTFAATLANPNGIQGALLPFNILNEYGYSIIENQTPSFLAGLFGFNLSIFIFKISAAVLAASLILNSKKIRHRFFETLISLFFIYAGFRMLRNLSLYALASFPVLALTLTDIQDYFLRLNLKGVQVFRRISGVFKVVVSALLILLIFLVANNSFYKYTNSSKAFGFSVPNGLSRAADFVKENKIEGPMFNNFDVGGYLIWQLYPQEKVFVDNRPEAYSVKFFNETYKPMQEDKEKWTGFSEKYGINFIFFGHADAAPWGDSFLRNIVKNPDWKTIYINEDAIILVKNNNKNTGIISKFSVTDRNAVDKITGYVKDSNKDEADLNLILSRVLYNIEWREASIYFSERAIGLNPGNSRAYLYKGLAHAYYTDKKNQELAAENIKKAIDLGLKNSQYCGILGIVYMNLGLLDEAKIQFIKALELDKDNKQAKDFLTKYFNY